MILTGVLAGFLFSLCLAATEGDSAEEIPFVVASLPNLEEGKAGDSIPQTEREELDAPDAPLSTHGGRSDIEIEDDQPSGGYFYPKPSRPFNLPEFKPLSGNAHPRVSFFAEENEQVERLPRSPRRRPPYFPSPPPFIPGFIPPNQIRPLPALYGRPPRF